MKKMKAFNSSPNNDMLSLSQRPFLKDIRFHETRLFLWTNYPASEKNISKSRLARSIIGIKFKLELTLSFVKQSDDPIIFNRFFNSISSHHTRHQMWIVAWRIPFAFHSVHDPFLSSLQQYFFITLISLQIILRFLFIIMISIIYFFFYV